MSPALLRHCFNRNSSSQPAFGLILLKMTPLSISALSKHGAWPNRETFFHASSSSNAFDWAYYFPSACTRMDRSTSASVAMSWRVSTSVSTTSTSSELFEVSFDFFRFSTLHMHVRDRLNRLDNPSTLLNSCISLNGVLFWLTSAHDDGSGDVQ